MRQLKDKQTYRKLSQNPFPVVVEKLNRLLQLAFNALIKELVRDLPSCVQDTKDVLRLLDIALIPTGVLLVGINAESLYTSIPHEWGLKEVAHFLEKKFPQI